MKLFDKAENTKIVLDLGQSLLDDLGTLLKIAVKSLFYGPVFYGASWLISHHAPTHDMWFAFFFAAYMFTSSRKKSGGDASKEQPRRTQSTLVLPAATEGSNERRN